MLPPPPVGPPAAGGTPATGRAITILVLGILGLLCCNLLSPVAWVMGHGELRDIRAGQAPPQDYSLAQIGMVLGILGSLLLAFALLWLFALGGMATLGVLLDR